MIRLVGLNTWLCLKLDKNVNILRIYFYLDLDNVCITMLSGSASECAVPHCDKCLSRSYCTQCRAPYVAHAGQCVTACPTGLHYAEYTHECRDRGSRLYNTVLLTALLVLSLVVN